MRERKGRVKEVRTEARRAAIAKKGGEGRGWGEVLAHPEEQSKAAQSRILSEGGVPRGLVIH